MDTCLSVSATQLQLAQGLLLNGTLRLSRAISPTAAWVDLGRSVPAVQTRRQHGGHLSLEPAC